MPDTYDLDELVAGALSAFRDELDREWSEEHLRTLIHELADAAVSHLMHTEVALRYALETPWLAVDVAEYPEPVGAARMIALNAYDVVYVALIEELEHWRAEESYEADGEELT
jgi:hypothetical protein